MNTPPRTYKKLAIHNSICNNIYFQFQDCLEDHPFGKWVGKCTGFGKELEKCIRQNRENMRERNKQLALEQLKKTREAAQANNKNKEGANQQQ